MKYKVTIIYFHILSIYLPPLIIKYSAEVSTRTLILKVNMVLRLSFACWDYDRMKAIEDGRVRPEGIELTFLNYRVEET
jgi:hypothetical protein